MSLDPATVRRIARLARIRLDDADVPQLQTELNGILGWIEQLNEVNVDGVEPLTGGAQMALKMRADEVTDGNITEYTGNTGFGWFHWPATLTVDLGDVFNLACIRFLLWDGLGSQGAVRNIRIYKYRLLTSVDHENWKVLFDSGIEGYNGWQVFSFPKHIQVRYIRIHGIWNSANSGFHVVQLEAHDSEPPLLEADIILRREIFTEEITVENSDGLPLASRVHEIINSLQTLIEANEYLNPKPFSELISDLRLKVTNIAAIELSMEAIRQEITEPVNQELKKASRLARFSVWGFWVGIIGGIMAILSLIIRIV